VEAGFLASGVALRLLGMAQNFLSCDREQELLLPPSLRDWLGPLTNRVAVEQQRILGEAAAEQPSPTARANSARASPLYGSR
jgi:hypothetical protein